MSTLNYIEQRIFFRIARFVAFVLALILFLAIIGDCIYVFSINQSTKMPTADDVVGSLKSPTPAPAANPSNAPAITSQQIGKPGDALAGLRFPAELQTTFAGDQGNLDTLRGWVESLPQEDRQQFLDELGRSVALAKQRGIDPADAINAYKERYFDAREQSAAASAAATEKKMYAAYAAATAMILITLFSLVLVLLAIERNTRSMEKA